VHAQGIEPEFTDAAVALAEEGFDPEFGARPLRRAIQRLVENELSRMVLGGDLNPGDRVVVDAEEQRIRMRPEAKSAPRRRCEGGSTRVRRRPAGQWCGCLELDKIA
jgi:ATP-dependent Clp protease ATP-binding subunit ClpC